MPLLEILIHYNLILFLYGIVNVSFNKNCSRLINLLYFKQIEKEEWMQETIILDMHNLYTVTTKTHSYSGTYTSTPNTVSSLTQTQTSSFNFTDNLNNKLRDECIFMLTQFGNRFSKHIIYKIKEFQKLKEGRITKKILTMAWSSELLVLRRVMDWTEHDRYAYTRHPHAHPSTRHPHAPPIHTPHTSLLLSPTFYYSIFLQV